MTIYQNQACVRTFSRPDWPVRAISFSHDGKMIASASEDLVIDIGHVQTGGKGNFLQHF
jgi:THO complex subunit 3